MFLHPWWENDVVPWLTALTALSPLLNDAPGGIPITVLAPEAAIQRGIAAASK